MLEHGHSIIQSYAEAERPEPSVTMAQVRTPAERLRAFWSGPRIRKLRIHLGLSYEKFGHALGVSWVTVRRWETGESQPQKKHVAHIEAFARSKLLPADKPAPTKRRRKS